MPALTNIQRQERYRDRQRRGELRRVTVVLPLEIEAKLRYLIAHTRETQTALLGRLVMEEWHRRGCPIPGLEDDEQPPSVGGRGWAGVSASRKRRHVHRQAP
jgi:hypothetical protein